MSFDSKNLERLRDFGERLPKSHSAQKASSQSNQKSGLHPIETEQDPRELFRELIKASHNGEVPHHLIERLKQLEDQELKGKATVKNNLQTPIQKDDLYISFRQLLLEEET